jgi:hypothetical protein
VAVWLLGGVPLARVLVKSTTSRAADYNGPSDRPVRRTGSGRRAPSQGGGVDLTDPRVVKAPRHQPLAHQYSTAPHRRSALLRKRVVRFVVVEGRGDVLPARTLRRVSSLLEAVGIRVARNLQSLLAPPLVFSRGTNRRSTTFSACSGAKVGYELLNARNWAKACHSNGSASMPDDTLDDPPDPFRVTR